MTTIFAIIGNDRYILRCDLSKHHQIIELKHVGSALHRGFDPLPYAPKARMTKPEDIFAFARDLKLSRVHSSITDTRENILNKSSFHVVPADQAARGIYPH